MHLASPCPESAERRIIGRRPCTWCGFAHAHVRRVEGKHAYLYCPSCGLSTIAKNSVQHDLIVAGMHSESFGKLLEPPHAEVPIVVADLVPKFRAGPWDQLLNKPGNDRHESTAHPAARAGR